MFFFVFLFVPFSGYWEVSLFVVDWARDRHELERENALVFWNWVGGSELFEILSRITLSMWGLVFWHS